MAINSFRNRVCVLLLLAGAACRPSSADEGASPTKSVAQKASPGEKLREGWYANYFQGQKIGYAHTVDERTQINGVPAYHLSRTTVLVVKRSTDSVRIESKLDTWVDADHAPMRFKVQRKEGAETRTLEGYRNGEQLVVRQAVGRNLTERKVPITKDLRLGASLDLVLADNLKVGTVIEGQALDEEQGDVIPYRIEVVSKDKAGVYFVKQALGPIQAELKVAADGTTLDVVLPAVGIRTTKVSREEAIQQTAPVDIFSASLFALPKPLPPRQTMEALTLRLKSKRGRPITPLEDARQKAKAVDGGVEVSIRVQSAPKRAVRRPIKDGRYARYLASTEYEPLDDESLQATAERLTRDKKTVWAAARAINAFVFGHIRDKSLARAFASAPEALAAREGDCTEHSVLFSALAKISGIPTRLVTGLIYVGTEDNVFGYHEWVEIWDGDRWLAMDPTWGQDIADATHLKLYAGVSDPAGLREAMQVTAGAIGDLELEAVNYRDAKGRTHPL